MFSVLFSVTLLWPFILSTSEKFTSFKKNKDTLFKHILRCIPCILTHTCMSLGYPPTCKNISDLFIQILLCFSMCVIQPSSLKPHLKWRTGFCQLIIFIWMYNRIQMQKNCMNIIYFITWLSCILRFQQ